MNELGTYPSSTAGMLIFERDQLQKPSLQTKRCGEPLNDEGKPKTVSFIQPGLVLIRSFLPDSEYQKLATTALSMGSEEYGENGFYTRVAATTQTDSSPRTEEGNGSDLEEEDVWKLNSGVSGRGRIFDAATRFPRHVVDPIQTAAHLARSIDSSMPGDTCTHILLNMYTSCDGLIWHRDIYENDGTSQHPAVNLCVGASCTFGYEIATRKENPNRNS